MPERISRVSWMNLSIEEILKRALQASGIDNAMFTNSSSKPRVRHERAT